MCWEYFLIQNYNGQNKYPRLSIKRREHSEAIRMIKFCFNKVELRQFLTSNYFAILYYNSEVWHLPSLHVNLKQYLLAASSAALKLCENKTEIRISYDLHDVNKRATPEKMISIKCKFNYTKSTTAKAQMRIGLICIFNKISMREMTKSKYLTT